MQPSTKDIGMTSNDPAAWIGSSERLADALDPGHAARIAAALAGRRRPAATRCRRCGNGPSSSAPWARMDWGRMAILARRFPAAGA